MEIQLYDNFKSMQKKCCATAGCALNADAQIKACHGYSPVQLSSYQHYSKALRHDICQEACCRVWPHHQEHIQVKYCCPCTLWGSTLSQLLFNLEVIFMTALGKLMALFPYRGKKKKTKKMWEVQHTIHTSIWMWWPGKEGEVRALGFFFFYIATWLVCHQRQRKVQHRASKN